MIEFVRLMFPFLAIFLVSLGISYFGTKLVLATKRPICPIPQSKVRIRASSGMYRSRYLGECAEGWQFGAPLCRDNYVPLRVGEELTVEAICDKGVMLFKTVVLSRDTVDHTLTFARPGSTVKTNRREEDRRTDVAGHPIEIEGVNASLLNLSHRGACLVTEKGMNPGDWVQVKLPWSESAVFGWVLAQDGQDQFKKVRIRFDESVALPKSAVA